ncbi:MAG: hypothetical protein WKG00_12050 [Polyangiaceae bacterium]
MEADVVPARLGTPAESRAARPWWGLSGYAPQIPQMHLLVWSDAPLAQKATNDELQKRATAAALFNAADGKLREVGALAGELVACGIAVRYAETKASVQWIFPIPMPLPGHRTTQADLRATLGYGAFATPEKPRRRGQDAERNDLVLSVDGPENSNWMAMTLPLAALKPGDPVTVELIDRGVFTDDAVFPTLRGRYDGTLPMVLSAPGARAECRLVPSAVVDSHLALALRASDETIAWMDTTMTGHLGERVAVSELTARLTYAAALVGWSDPRVVRRIDRAALLLRRIHAETRAEGEAKVKALPPPSTFVDVAPGGFALRVDELVCGAGAAREASGYNVSASSLGCVLRVSVKNLGKEAARVSSGACAVSTRVRPGANPFIVELALYDRYSRSLPCQALFEPRVRDEHDVTIAPGATATVRFGVHREGEFAKPYFGSEPAPFAGDLAAVGPVLVRTFFRVDRYEPAQREWLRTE